ncbi:MAG: hypothetical protein GY769_02505 [bacterium]|nr:hypothetical protein [bacterium]
MRRLTRALIGFSLALVFGLAPGVLRAAEKPPRRIVAVGDVHGAPGAFLKVLRAAGIVDDTGDWIGGNAILVQTGDLTDRGSEVRAVLDLMRNLEQSAPESGGRVVSLLGNHEVFNLIGYYDYQSTPLPVFAEIAAAFADEGSERTRKKAYKRFSNWAERYGGCALTNKDEWMARNPLGFIEYQEALSPRGEYGRWLRERLVVANVQDTLFVHGGLSPELLEMEIKSLDAINATAAEELEQFDRDHEWLEREGIVLPFSTLGELHCAMAYELYLLGSGELSDRQLLRRRQLEDVRARLPSAETWLLLDPRGPVWFRGYAKWPDDGAEVALTTIFETFGGERVVVGHTPQPGAIVSRFDERIFLIDTAMAYPELEGRAAALEFRGDEISAIYKDERILLTGGAPTQPEGADVNGGPPFEEDHGHPAAPYVQDVGGAGGQDEDAAQVSENLSLERGWLAQDGSPLPFTSEEALLDFLKSARVVKQKTVGKGITRAKRVVLEKDGIRARAVFHDVDLTKRRHRLAKGVVIMHFRDSYFNNVAAYELGRLLGLTNLPPATTRRLGAAKGSIQLWIEKARDEAQRQEKGGGSLTAKVRRRIADMWVFDNLIGNTDRNQGNMLHDSRGEFWWIDHTRSFGSSKQLLSPAKMRRCSRSLLEAIRDLDEEETRDRLRPYISSFEIKALFARREKLLEYLDEQIASRGEDAFLFSYGDLDDAVQVIYQPSDVPKSAADG